MTPDIFTKRQSAFVLWRAAAFAPPPVLVIGRLQLGAPVTLADGQRFPLAQLAGQPDLWSVAAANCNLIDDEVYHYWFEVTDVHPGRVGQRILVTDPLAYTVDWRLRATPPAGRGYTNDDSYPAAVIMFRGGQLIPCDGGGETTAPVAVPALADVPTNNRIVIYELPTAWTSIDTSGLRERGIGTFRDVMALVVKNVAGANFPGLAVARAGRSYLVEELGINALELLPPADSMYVREWGYGTTNFFAPDFELGFPRDSSHPTPNRDFAALVTACHEGRIRVFVDVAMAFARANAYLAAATDDFFILDPKCHPEDPDAHNSRGKDKSNIRDGFGSDLFRFETFFDGYDPLTGTNQSLSPAAQLLKASVLRWMTDFRIGGLRLDSVENVFSWNFVQQYKDLARTTWMAAYGAADADAAAQRILVVGEELSEPLALLGQRRLDGLWHESFKRYIRAALIGESATGETFEGTIRKAIDCRNFGYSGLSEAIIYLTSHDVEGWRNERLYNFFRNNQVVDAERRIKLAFACLLTAVGVPQILAGDEFADEHDLFDADGAVDQAGGKQVDPVNYSRLEDDWRQRIKDYVGRLVKLRTQSNALAVNDTDFIHIDTNGKQVFVWQRGIPGMDDCVVVVANFSDFSSTDSANGPAEYVVPNWPRTPPGKRWREITQERDVLDQWVAREGIFAWEAKVYALV